ncbi:hypothetical protein N9J72_01940 [Candidatus Gracilibacteria bacterium]|nr:hypothetical protein [Candidatus Gracilibacteria bacterium]
MFSKISIFLLALIVSSALVFANDTFPIQGSVSDNIIVVEQSPESDIFQVENQSGFLEIVVID